MKAFYIMILLKIISDVAATKPKSVNLALETVMEFGNKNSSDDLKFLENVQNVLDKLKNVLGKNTTSRRFGNEKENIQFADFVKHAIDILKTYNDNDLEDVFDVFDEEIRKYHYRGCKFHELVKNQNLRRFVGNQLSGIKQQPAAQLRKSLDKVGDIIDDAKFDGGQIQFIDYINSLYRPDSTDKLKTFLENLQSYAIKSKRANLDLIQIVRNGIRSVIFDHISQLNPNVRKELKIQLETIWNDTNHQNRVNHREWAISYPGFSSEAAKYNDQYATDKKRKNSRGKVVADKIPDTDSDKSETSYDEAQSSYKVSQKKTKPRYAKHNRDVAIVKYVTPKKRKSNHKKLAPYITLYPEDITISKHKKSKRKHSKKAKPPKLQKEFVEVKRKQKMDDSLSSETEMDDYDFNETPDHALISEHKSVINIDIAPEDHKKHKHLRDKTKRNIPKLTTKQQKRYRSKNTKKNPNKSSHKKFRKNIQMETSPSLSEEGMSIERFDVERRTMSKTQNVSSIPDDLKVNVLSRIYNLEKEMEEVKSKIDTKIAVTENVTENVNNYSLIESEFEPLEIWKSTKANTIKNTNDGSSKTVATKGSSKTSRKKVTTKKITKTVKKNNQHTNKTTKSPAVFRSIIDLDDIVKSNKSLNITNEAQINNTIDVESINENDVSANEPDPSIILNMKATTKDEDLDSILKKYSVGSTQYASTKLDIDKFMADVSKTSDVGTANDKFEIDLKKIMDATAKPNVGNNLEDPFQDMDTALGLI